MGEICKYASRAQRAVVYFLVSELIFKRCQGRYFLLTLPSWTRRGVSFTVIIQVFFFFYPLCMKLNYLCVRNARITVVFGLL